MQTFRGILIKTCSKTMQRIYLRGLLQGHFLINSMHAPSITSLIALPCFHLLNCKGLLQVVWIPQWYFATYATRSINIGTKCLNKILKSLKQKFQKLQVLEDKTKLYSKNFGKPIAYLRFCLKICLC